MSGWAVPAGERRPAAGASSCRRQHGRIYTHIYRTLLETAFTKACTSSALIWAAQRVGEGGGRLEAGGGGPGQPPGLGNRRGGGGMGPRLARRTARPQLGTRSTTTEAPRTSAGRGKRQSNRKGQREQLAGHPGEPRCSDWLLDLAQLRIGDRRAARSEPRGRRPSNHPPACCAPAQRAGTSSVAASRAVGLQRM